MSIIIHYHTTHPWANMLCSALVPVLNGFVQTQILPQGMSGRSRFGWGWWCRRTHCQGKQIRGSPTMMIILLRPLSSKSASITANILLYNTIRPWPLADAMERIARLPAISSWLFWIFCLSNFKAICLKASALEFALSLPTRGDAIAVLLLAEGGHRKERWATWQMLLCQSCRYLPWQTRPQSPTQPATIILGTTVSKSIDLFFKRALFCLLPPTTKE